MNTLTYMKMSVFKVMKVHLNELLLKSEQFLTNI